MREYAAAFTPHPFTENPSWQRTVNMFVSDRAAPEPLPPIVKELWMGEQSSFQQQPWQSRMADIRVGSAFWIGERPDLTVVISDTSGDQKSMQEDGVILKLHKSVLSENEYFKQRFDAQPDVSQ